jgi:hypothetical protein
MQKPAFHKINLKINLLLVATALIFGQVGAGFFHNKHDAHETVIDLNSTVLLPHGEHCKVCSVDWVHQFLASGFDIGSVEEEHISYEPVRVYSIINSSRLLTNDRAPPFIA